MSRLTTRRYIVAAFLALILAASAARLLTFDRYLPYIDHNDEPNTYILARIWRGLETDAFMARLMDGYPPLYVEVNIGVQRLVEAVSTKPWLGAADYSYALRLLAALVGIATTLIVIRLGWQLGGPVAGWFAGLVWGLAPLVVENNNYAISDPFVYLGAAIALSAAVDALRKRQPAWTLVSLIGGLIAVFSKYTAIAALLPGAIAGLALVLRQPRRTLPWALAGIALVGGAAVYLVAVYGAFDLSIQEAQRFRGDGLNMALSPARNLNNFLMALAPLGWPIWAVTVGLGALAYLASRRQRRTAPLWPIILIVLPYSTLTLIMSASATNAWLDKMRHVLPLTLPLSALWGVALAQIALTLADVGRRLPSHWRSAPAAAALALVAVIAGWPMIAGALQNVRQFSLPNTRALIRQWSDVNIPADGRILMHPTGDLERTWNRNWGGYGGVQTFDWWFTDDPTVSMPAEYAAQGITYFAVSDADLAMRYTQPAMVAFLDQLTLLKRIPGAPDHAGPTVSIYRMTPPQNAVWAEFGGEIALVGYDWNRDSVAPGESLRFRPYWRMLRPPSSNYSVFLHLTTPDGERLIAQADGAPGALQRPTLAWDDRDELYLGGEFSLGIPADTPPGTYALRIGLYDFITGRRLALSDQADTYRLNVVIGGVVAGPGS
ncbi:MAG: glycosyltransferase family 39 protein [Anaerolineae bacterium]|nr:glycosyltransferase family 39 protein [Anaerolineae bacterium]